MIHPRQLSEARAGAARPAPGRAGRRAGSSPLAAAAAVLALAALSACSRRAEQVSGRLEPGSASISAGEAAPPPKLGELPRFELVDQTGQPFTPATMRGKVWAAAFVFTRCPSVCPMMTARMKQLQQRAASAGVPLHLVSFSVDPDFDTPEVLTAYARRFAVDTERWTFVTGDSEAIRDAAEQGFKIGVSGQADPSAPNFGITHGTHLVLLDPQLRIRGYYQSAEPARIDALLQSARALAAESP